LARIGIHQPNYAPWAGYFAKMASVDAFVFLDNCQMPIGRSYVSRVQIMGREGAEWMTVPVKRHEGRGITAVRFADGAWARKHLRTMQVNYGRCPFFESVTGGPSCFFQRTAHLRIGWLSRNNAPVVFRLGAAMREYRHTAPYRHRS
jgi:hypothetical protein